MSSSTLIALILIISGLREYGSTSSTLIEFKSLGQRREENPVVIFPRQALIVPSFRRSPLASIAVVPAFIFSLLCAYVFWWRRGLRR